jgi:hypothetical protein
LTQGERAGRWALAYLLMALFAAWFTIVCIVGWHIKQWFL